MIEVMCVVIDVATMMDITLKSDQLSC
jgi:hypothetical protein